MTTPLLVVTSDNPFGESIRQSLEGTGRFSLRVVSKINSALVYTRDTGCPLVFLDADLRETDALSVGRALREADPQIRLIIISESGQQPALEELASDGFLSKPFNLPDLMGMLESVLAKQNEATRSKSNETPVESPTDGEIPWQSDVNRAAQHLTRLTLETSAQAALITRQDELWAYVGQLPQAAALELADTVARYWNKQEESDLVRFVRLNSTGAEHMFYATRLAAGLLLALIFDAETSFSTIRTQANRLARSLSNLPSSVEPGTGEEEGETPEIASLTSLLADVPPPNPPKDVHLAPPDTLTPSHSFSQESSPAQPFLPLPPSRFSQESSPAIPSRPLVYTDYSEPVAEAPELETTAKTKAVTRENVVRKDKPAPDQLDKTQPRSVTEIARRIVLEPVSPSVYNLTYACLLIPRFIHHYLTGDLSVRLSEWVPEICIAFGWRLEYISVRPDYLQWIVNVPPATSPAYLMRIMRQHTSEKIFTDFPRFKKENPSGDFWAPGYLIMGGMQPPPAQLIKDFIQQTREKQGLSWPLPPK